MDFYLAKKPLRCLTITTLLLILVGCSKPDKFEAILPAKSETCGGKAITSKYIIHYKSGRWDYIENHDRENFKLSYVATNFDEIDFIEYDQEISIKDIAPSATATGIDNWGANAIEAQYAWQKNLRGESIVVAVIDTGVDARHPQLATQIEYNLSESGEKQKNGIDDDNNGFVDDYAGYNFYKNNADISDEVGHGTHVSGIIAAAHNDTTIKSGYMQGVAPDAKILPVKFLGEDGGTLSSALKGIDYAILRGAKVINASWGGPGCSSSLRQKVIDAANSNVLFVTAAGNNGANLDLVPEYPAAFNLPLQITVGSITPSLNMSNFSNYSTSLVHIFAPGTAVVSTYPGGGYAAMSGTSMAAPFVAAASAVLLGANPSLSLQDVRQRLLETAIQNESLLSTARGRMSLYQAFH